MLVERDVRLPRNAFSSRDAARAGDVWRLCQDIAILGSTAAGWPPARFREEAAAFVVREMTLLHHRESRFGEALRARTWVGDFRRGVFTTRQIRIGGDDGPVASAVQEWVHVKIEDGALKPARASDALIAAFPTSAIGEPVALPQVAPLEGREHRWSFRAWHTWMDPLAHANHPAYVDWCDEAISVAMAGAGLDPVLLQPVAEQVKWRSGVEAPSEVVVRTRVVGVTPGGDVACAHQIETADGECATARTFRRLAGSDPERLLAALR